jgi:ubiquinone/menaquinone biosynthesis C-methylase UbiE
MPPSNNAMAGVDQVDVVAEATDLPFADGELDYVASSHVLEHLPDIFSAWLEWWRVLRPGGISFMIVPKRDAWWKTACGRLPGCKRMSRHSGNG